MIEGQAIPEIGATIELARGSLVARGVVMWTSHQRCGLNFSSSVSVKDWLTAPSALEQQRVDQLVALVKAGSVPAMLRLESESIDQEARPSHSLAGDLELALEIIQKLGEELAASDDTLARHGNKLQYLDIAMQMLRVVARELKPGSSGREGVASLESLRTACTRAAAAFQ